MTAYGMHKSVRPTQMGDSSWKIAFQFRQISEKMFSYLHGPGWTWFEGSFLMQWYGGRTSSLNKINLWVAKPAKGMRESMVQKVDVLPVESWLAVRWLALRQQQEMFATLLSDVLGICSLSEVRGSCGFLAPWWISPVSRWHLFVLKQQTVQLVSQPVSLRLQTQKSQEVEQQDSGTSEQGDAWRNEGRWAEAPNKAFTELQSPGSAVRWCS